MPSDTDRRKHARLETDRLGLVFGGRYYPVVDISRGGLSFHGPDMGAGQIVIAEIAYESRPAEGEFVVVRVRESAGGLVRAEFTSTDSRSVGVITGTEPPAKRRRRKRAAASAATPVVVA